MKELAKIFIPPIVGVLVIILSFKIEEWINPSKEGEWYFESLTVILYGLIFILAIIFQLAVVLTFLSWKKKNNFFIPLVYLVIIPTLIFSIIETFLLWQKEFGIYDFLYSLILFVCLNLIYWSINILIVNKFEKINGAKSPR